MTNHQAAIDRFRSRVAKFIKRHKIAPSTFGRKALGDPTFFALLQAGRVPRPETMNAVERFMAEYAEAKRAA
jgi:hypothetical protein